MLNELEVFLTSMEAVYYFLFVVIPGILLLAGAYKYDNANVGTTTKEDNG
jgi:hypothetical protein